MRASLVITILFCGILFNPLKAQKNLYSDSITVYYFLSDECKICQYYALEIRSIYEDFASDSVQFVGLFPNRYSTIEAINEFKEIYEFPFLLKKEYYQTKTKAFDVTITPEVVVFDEKEQQILYQGRIDESYLKIGKRRRVVKQQELRKALESIQNGKKIEISETNSVGCFISFVD